MILLLGSEGSMGRRYSAILRYLGKDFVRYDKGITKEAILNQALKSEGVIIATPTDTHADYIDLLGDLKKPILCEKPVTKDVTELRRILKKVRDSETPFRMTYQYQMLVDRDRIGRSHYDYYNHGKDGLIWDCMQTICLARGEVQLREESPVWSCMINGQRINPANMDAAYIGYVQLWFKQPGQDLGKLIAGHERVAEAQRRFEAGKEVGCVRV